MTMLKTKVYGKMGHCLLKFNFLLNATYKFPTHYYIPLSQFKFNNYQQELVVHMHKKLVRWV